LLYIHEEGFLLAGGRVEARGAPRREKRTEDTGQNTEENPTAEVAFHIPSVP
jgi:hypothetical protein